MEKLIELLKNWDGRNVTYNKQSDGGYMFRLGDLALREERICSKKFGFIKWLVKNDKISYKKLLENSNFIEIRSIGRGIAYSLTMLLAIQDEPIDFLISILK